MGRMKKTQGNLNPIRSLVSEPVLNLGRRAFIISAAAAVSAAAFWGLRRSTIAAARPLAADEGPKSVTVVQFSPEGKQTGTVTVPRVIKTDDEWKRQLSEISYCVTRHADTERPFTGASWNEHNHGLFRCICCDLALFSSDTKFDSGTGWPSFWQPIAEENVVKTVDGSFGRCAPPCRAGCAMRISAMCSTTALSPPACAIA